MKKQIKNQNKILRDIFVDLIYPRRCPVCDDLLPQGVSYLCAKHTNLPYIKEPTCFICGKEIDDESEERCDDCKTKTHYFDRCFAAFSYVSPVKEGVLAIKFHERREYVDFYASKVVEVLKPYMPKMKIDGVIYVPMYKKKQKIRGYNQAELIAEKIARSLELPLYKDVLIRGKSTRAQKELGSMERANNIKNAIKLNRLPENVNNLLLVDDIYTTGATMDACSEILKKSGVRKIYGAVICVGKGK